jgi:hypothetical protein
MPLSEHHSRAQDQCGLGKGPLAVVAEANSFHRQFVPGRASSVCWAQTATAAAVQLGRGLPGLELCCVGGSCKVHESMALVLRRAL